MDLSDAITTGVISIITSVLTARYTLSLQRKHDKDSRFIERNKRFYHEILNYKNLFKMQYKDLFNNFTPPLGVDWSNIHPTTKVGFEKLEKEFIFCKKYLSSTVYAKYTELCARTDLLLKTPVLNMKTKDAININDTIQTIDDIISELIISV